MYKQFSSCRCPALFIFVVFHKRCLVSLLFLFGSTKNYETDSPTKFTHNTPPCTKILMKLSHRTSVWLSCVIFVQLEIITYIIIIIIFGLALKWKLFNAHRAQMRCFHEKIARFICPAEIIYGANKIETPARDHHDSRLTQSITCTGIFGFWWEQTEIGNEKK